jgi:uncharacterized protein
VPEKTQTPHSEDADLVLALSARSKLAMTQLAQLRIAEFSRFKLRVSSSKIHRLGVFAAQNIPARAKVIEYSGKRLNRRQACEVFRERLASRSSHLHYLARVNSYWTVDGADEGSGAEFINHCCDPNLVMKTVRDHIWLISVRRIRRGEELSSDYAYDPKGMRVPCHCGSPKCRGTLNRAMPESKRKKKK